MSEHTELSFVRLLDWVEGRLGADEAAAMTAAVAAAGPDVKAQVAWLRDFLAVREKIVLAAPPPSVRQALTARFAAFAQEKRPPTFVQRLVAAITFDSTHQLAPAGARGAGGEPRQLLYVTDAADVVLDLHERRHDNRVDLLGQILPKADVPVLADLAVQLLHQEREVGMTLADYLGEFTFSALAPGQYQLVVSGDDYEILLAPFDLNR